MNFPWMKIIAKKPTGGWNLTTYKDGEPVNFHAFENVVSADIFDEYGNRINTKDNEFPEQCIASTYIDPDSVVLELGARYGSVSCIINKKLNTKTNQVSVEPDSSVWSALEKNIEQNNCSVNLFKGFVSKKKRHLITQGYGATSAVNEDSTLPSASVEDIESMYGLKFDTLVADCEGFLQDFFDEHPHLYTQLRTVIFEADYPEKCNYELIHTRLKANGFTPVLYGFQNVYKK